MARSFAAKRRKEWSSMGNSSLAFTASSTAVGGNLAFGTGGFTVLRLRGEILVTLTAGGTFAAGDQALLTMAAGMVSTDAATLGATAVPDPGTTEDIGFPWIWWYQTVITAFSNSAESTNEGISNRIVVDSSAMRKVDTRQSLIWVFQYEDVAGAPPVTVMQANCRVLLALP